VPLYRVKCGSCGVESIDLARVNDPSPDHCGQPMAKLMPTRVAGWVRDNTPGWVQGGLLGPDEQYQMPGTEKIAEASAPQPGPTLTPIDTSPLAFPVQTNWSKDYDACSASERDDRWRDTHAAMSAWQTRCLEADGVDPSEARARATEHQTKVISESRESSETA
jgi:hypothetical protein